MTSAATTQGLVDTTAAPSVLQQVQWAIAAGTVDVITAVYPTTVVALSDGLCLAFRALGANATTTPTFSPDGLPAWPIVKKNNIALAASDIAGSGHEIMVRYNANTKTWAWVTKA